MSARRSGLKRARSTPQVQARTLRNPRPASSRRRLAVATIIAEPALWNQRSQA